MKYHNFFKTRLLRNIILPIIKLTKHDRHINHHWVKNPIKINTYLHKGYWFYGKNREKETLEIFSKVIKRNDIVVEIGGHIGYFSLYFSNIVGEKGKVFVFEPGLNNLPYIKSNVKNHKNIYLIEKAVGDRIGITNFYIDNITGQNNSIVKDFDGLKNTIKYSMDKDAGVEKVEVEMITLDSFCEKNIIKPDVIKIDVEGFEYEVLLGSEFCLSNFPIIMVEVQRNHEEIFDFFYQKNYLMFNVNGKNVDKNYLINCDTQNIFCFHQQKHKELLQKLF